MEKTITIKIEDARKWYLSGNDDLKGIALSAYTEDELVIAGLPTSEEEFKQMYMNCEIVNPQQTEEYEAHVMLRKLRDLYRGCSEWEYRELLGYGYQYCIVRLYDDRHESRLQVSAYQSCYNEFLSFNSYEVAKKFLACFEPLIKKAGDLI
jgi:hypothetical protein